MANDPRFTRQHPDPARPDDPLIPNPGDPYPGHPDPAYPSADHPQQRRATHGDAVERPMVAGEGGEDIEPPNAPPRRQHGAQNDRANSSARQSQAQQSAQPSPAGKSSPFGDPSPGDENPRPVPPAGSPPQRS